MVNHLLETSHPFSSSALRFCVSAPSPSSILRTHFQVPYPVSPLIATLTKTLGGGGILPILKLALLSISSLPSLPRYFLASSPFNRLLALRGGQTGEGGTSAVGFLAMTDRMDVQGTGRFFGEADAVVADAETQLGGLPLELFDIALVGLGEAMERLEDAPGGVAVETADIGTGAFRPGDFLHA